MNNNDLTKFIANSINQKLTSSRRKLILVGIEGKGCTGKSRMSHLLKDELKELGIPSDLVSIDDFCNPRRIRHNSETELGLQVYFNNFDEEYFLSNVIKKAYEEEKIEFKEVMLNAALDTYSNEVQIDLPTGGVLLVEGLHILKETYAKYFSFSIFLYISDEVQLKRALIRDKEERGKDHESILNEYESRFVPSYNYFVENDRPLAYTDIFIDYEHVNNPIIIDNNEAEGVLYET